MSRERPSWWRGHQFWDQLCAIYDKGLAWTWRAFRQATRRRRRGSWPPRTRLAVEGLEVRLVPANPVANTDSFSIPNNQTLNVSAPGILANDYDPNGLSMTAVHYGGPMYGSLTLNANGSFTYTPSPTFTGQDGFTYQATDTQGASQPTGVYITVTAPVPAVTVSAIAPVENQAFSGTVATFTNPGFTSGFNAYINWGDGVSGSGSVASNGQGGFTVTGYHTYTEEANDTLTVTVGNPAGQSGQGSTTIHVADRTVTPAGGLSIAAAEGSSTSQVTVATFTDPAGPEAIGAYSATLDWGDHTTATSGTITRNQGSNTFTVQGNHTYTDEGSYTVTVTVHHDSAPDATTTSTVTAADPAATGTAATISAVEGSTTGTVTVATFTDPGGAEAVANYSATIDWGDGAVAGGLSYDAGTGIFSVTGSHTYTEDGSHSVQVTIHHDSAPTTTVSSTVQVADPAVTPTGGFTPTGVENSSTGAVTVATFTDPGGAESVGDYSATIDWGDQTATSAGTLSLDSATGIATVQGSHTYAAEGSYTVSVTVHHDSAPDATTTSSLAIADAAVTGAPTTIGATEDSTTGTVIVATFTDPAGAEAVADYSASIAWGDGSSATTGTITLNTVTGIFQVTGSHTYAEEGTYTPQVTISHDSAPATTVSSTAQVQDAPLTTLLATGLGVQATETAPLTAVPLATFTGAGTDPTNYSAQVNWGDGSTPAAATVLWDNTAQHFAVQGSHTYTEEGAYPLTVTITAASGLTAVTRTTAAVADAAVTGAGVQPLTVPQGQLLNNQLLATFHDANTAEPATSFTAQIRWGDGTTSTGTVSLQNGTLAVQGSHTYTLPGAFTAAITVTSDGLTYGPALDSVTVQPTSPPPGPLSLTPTPVQAVEGTLASALAVATWSDANVAHPAACHSATINWGDGSPTTAATLTGNAVTGSHLYSAAGTYLVTVTATDGEGDQLTAYTTATVSDPSLALTATSLTAAANVAFGPVLLANLTDANAAATGGNLNATVNWGDGSAPAAATVAGSGGRFWLAGGHTYALTGTYTYLLTVTDAGGAWTTTTGQVQVGPAQETQAATVTLLGFADTDPQGTASDYTASIAWGDNTTSAGAISSQGAVFQVTATHTWPAAGYPPVAVTVQDSGGRTLTANPAVVVADAPLTAGSALTLSGSEGLALSSQVATFTDADSSATATQFTAAIDWGDGTRTTGTVAWDSAHQVFTVSGNHTYSEAGACAVAVLLQDTGSGTLVATASTNIADRPLALTLVPPPSPVALVGTPTGLLTLGQLSDTNALADGRDLAVTINWGDSTSSAGTLLGVGGPGPYTVQGQHTYTQAGSDTVTVTVTDVQGSSTSASTPLLVVAGALNGDFRSDDPQNALLLPVGTVQLSPNTGGLRLSQPLDFDLSPGTDVGGNPALVYNSLTTTVRPLVSVQLGTDPAQPVPVNLQAQLTWDGAPQGWQSFSTVGHAPGNNYLLGLQVATPVTQSRVYGWSVQVLVDYGPNPNDPSNPNDHLIAQATTAGQAPVVVQDSSAYAAGWGIQGVDRLVGVCGGLLWITGSGDQRFFAANANGTYTSPPEDLGTLTQSGDYRSFTYTTLDQTRWTFTLGPSDPADPASSTVFLLSSVTDRDSVTRSYQYNSTGRLTQVNTPDGGVTALTYDAVTGLLATITEPGGRVVTLTHSTTNLTGLTDVDGSNRQWTYDNQHHLTEDVWAPFDAHVVYDAATGLVQRLDLGQGSVWQLVPAAAQGLPTNPAASATLVNVATLTDPLTHATTYQVDDRGRELSELGPTGNLQTWQRNAAGQPTQYTDGRGLQTVDVYNSAGDLLEQDNPDGSFTQWQYDPVFHQVTRTIQSLAPGHTTTTVTACNNTGDPTSTTTDYGTANAATTLYVWHTGLLQSTTDPDNNVTDYTYDLSRRETEQKTFAADGTPVSDQHYGYDLNGNLASTLDGDVNLTRDTYSPANRLLHEQVYAPDQTTLVSDTTYGYTAAGEVTLTTDGDGNRTVATYTNLGLVATDQRYARDGTLAWSTVNQYDLAGRLTQTTDGTADSTRYTYDAAGKLLTTKVYAPDGTTLVRSAADVYDRDGNLLQTTDGVGNDVQLTYDAANQLLTRKVYAPDGTTLVSSETNTYDLAGRLLKTVDGLGNYTQNTYDDNGLLLTVQRYNASGTLVSAATNQYDLDGNLVKVVDGLGNATLDTYDANGALLTEKVYSATGTLVSSTTNEYDLAGQLTKTTDALGNYTQTTYDAAGQILTEKVYSVGGTLVSSTANEYDLAGQLTKTTDALGNYTQTTYDAAGQILSEKVYSSAGALASSTTDTYNLDGELTQSTDALGNYTQETYDANGQVLTEKVYSTQNVLVSSQTNEYDLVGQLTKATDALGNYTQKTYDAAGQILTEKVYNAQNVLVSSTTDTYNLDGELTQSTDALGNYTQETYDANGQVLTEKVYNALNVLVSSQTNEYDLAGQLTKTTDALGNYTQTTYDASGQVLTEKVYSAQNVLVSSTTDTYNLDGQLTQTTDALGNYTQKTYDADGQVLTEKVYSAQNVLVSSTTDTYNLDGQLIQSTDALGNYTQETYDANGQLLTENVYSAQNVLASSTTDTYNLDGQLTQSTDALGNYTQKTYNANGQILTEKVYSAQNVLVSSTTDTYNLDGQLIQSTDALGNYTQKTYDAAGQVLTEKVYNAQNVLVSSTTDTYNLDGQLTQSTDALGNYTQETYDANGQLLTENVYSAQNVLVSSTTDTYNLDGQLTQSTDALGNYTQKTYDASGQVLTEKVYSAQNVLVSSTTDTYNLDGQLIQSTDALGNYTHETYDANGQVLTEKVYSAQNVLVSSTTDTYNLDGQLTQSTDALGNYTQKTYDANGQVLTEKVYSATGTLVSSTTDAYNLDGQLTQSTDALGNYTQKTYDAAGQILTEKVYSALNVLVNSTTDAYNLDGQLTQSTDALGNYTQKTYDAAGRLLTQQQFNANGTLVSGSADVYDLTGNLIKAVDGDGNYTQSTYDAAGKLLSAAHYSANGTLLSSEANTYDQDGRLTQTTDADGGSTSYTYTAAGQVASVTDQTGKTTYSYYDLDGQLIRQVDPDGNITVTTYDGDGRVLTTQRYAPDGITLVAQTTNTYDLDGHLLQSTDSLGQTTQYSYNAAGQVTSTTDPTGKTTQTVYDLDGHAIQQVDPLGHTTATTYNALGEVLTTTDGDGYTTHYGYDQSGELTALTDASGNISTFTYAAAGHKLTATDPLGHITRFTYDDNGNVTSETDATGRQRVMTYDGDNRLVQEVWYAANGSVTDTLSYTYDAAGRLLTAGNNNGSYTFTYDADGRVLTVQEPFGVSLAFTYDADGNRIAVQDSLGGTTTSSYNPEGLLASRSFSGPNQTAIGVDLSYTLDGQIQTVQRRTGSSTTTPVAATTYGYDADGRVQTLQHTDAANHHLADYTYTYDANGNVTSETKDSTTTAYTYDAANQLLSDGSSTQSYDSTGNRTTTGYVTGPDNQLLSDGVNNYTYDAAGNLTGQVNIATGQTTHYGYDNLNHMTEMDQWSGDPNQGGTLEKQAIYEYDVFGNRLQQAVDPDGAGPLGQDIKRYAYDAWGHGSGPFVGKENWDVWAILNGNNNSNALLTRYLRGDVLDQVFAREDSTGLTAWYLTDRQGSTRNLIDNSGLFWDTLTYNGFGQIESESNVGYGDSYKWTGRQYDQETGFQYNRDRYYDSQIGRWTTEDRAGFHAGDSNLYRYVNNQPTMATDPSGRALLAADRATADAFVAWFSGRKGEWTGHIDAKLALKTLRVSKVPGSESWMITADNPFEVTRTLAKVHNHWDHNSLGAVVDLSHDSILRKDGERYTLREKVTMTPEQKDVWEARTFGKIAQELAAKASASPPAPPQRPIITMVMPTEPTKLETQYGARGERSRVAMVLENPAVYRKYAEQKYNQYTALKEDSTWGYTEKYYAVPYSGNQLTPTTETYTVVERSETAERRAQLDSRFPWAHAYSHYLRAQFDAGRARWNANERNATLLGGYENFIGREQPNVLRRESVTDHWPVLQYLNEAEYRFENGEAILGIANAVLAVDEAMFYYSIAKGTVVRIGRALASHGLEAAGAGVVRRALPATLAEAESVGVGASRRAARHGAHLPSLPALSRSCFVAGTPLLTPDGDKPIEQFRLGDWVLSRSEDDPNGPVQPKIVEEIFVRVAPILKLVVAGRVIQTTAEHPFYVRGKGWKCAKELQRGEYLSSHDGQWVTVEQVVDLKEVTTVYNLRVSDYHTYFVGSREWSFSVWAHNANYDWFVHDGVHYLRNSDGQIFRSMYQTEASLLTNMEGQTLTRLASVPEGFIPPRVLGNATWVNPANPSHVHPDLPVRLRGDPTSGIMEFEGQAIRLRSGRPAPPSAATNIPNLSENAQVALSHTEGWAAAIMRRNGIMDAELTINHTRGPCSFCNGADHSGISEILLPGQRLHVNWPLPNGNVGHGYFDGGVGWIQLASDF